MPRINREKFLQALESVRPGLSQKDIVEQSSCFIFRDGEVMSFNDEVACRMVSGLATDFTGAIPAAPLLAILEKLLEEELQIDIMESELVLTGKGRRSGITMEQEVTLPVEHVEKPGEWLPLHKDFCEAIGVVVLCASKDESRFGLTCVQIHPKWVEACDDQQLCRWRMKTGLANPTLVRSSSIKFITSLGMTEFSETEGWMHFRNDQGLVLSCRRYMEDYPDLGEILKVSGVQTALPKGLVEAADKAQVFSAENTENNLVLIDLLPGKLRIKGQGVLGWYKEAKKISYTGHPMSFMISPQLLMDLVKRHSTCELCGDKLKVDGGSYIFVCCLDTPQDNGSNGVEEELAPPKKNRRERETVPAQEED